MVDQNGVAVDRAAKHLLIATQRDVAAASGKGSGAQAQSDIEIQLYRYVIQSGSVARDELDPENTSSTAITSMVTYPNPFAGTVTISYDLARSASVRLELFDVRGVRVLAVHKRQLAAGSHDVSISDVPFAPGVYFAVLTTGNERRTKKFVVVN